MMLGRVASIIAQMQPTTEQTNIKGTRDASVMTPAPNHAPTPMRNLAKQHDAASEEVCQSCDRTPGCIRPTLHEGACMDGQCSPICSKVAGDQDMTASEYVNRAFAVGDRIRSRRHHKEGLVVAVDSAGDPKVLYDGETEARTKKGKTFEVIATTEAALQKATASRNTAVEQEAALQKATARRNIAVEQVRKKLAEERALGKSEHEVRRQVNETLQQAETLARNKDEALQTASVKEDRHRAEAEEGCQKAAQAKQSRQAANKAMQKVSEEDAQLRVEAEEVCKKAAEAEARRFAAEEALKKAVEENDHWQAEAENARRKRAEAETRRQAAIEALQKASEEDDRRRAEAEERHRKVVEAEARRQVAEEEALQQTAEVEALREAETDEVVLEQAHQKEADAEGGERISEENELEREMIEADERCVAAFLECIQPASWRLPIRTPIKGTILYTRHMRPCRAAGTSVDVKDSSFQSLRNFLSFLEKEGLIRLKPGLTDPVVVEIRHEVASEYEYVPVLRTPANHDVKAARKAETGSYKPRATEMNVSAVEFDLKPLSSLASSLSITTGAKVNTSAPHGAGNAASPPVRAITEHNAAYQLPTPAHAYYGGGTCAVGAWVAPYVVTADWSSSDPSALSVWTGTRIFVQHQDGGWAYGAREDGAVGWLPQFLLSF